MPANPKDSLLDFNTLHCPDRIVISGTSIDIGHHDAMRHYCRSHHIDEFYLAAWARPLTDRIRTLAEEAACHSGKEMVDCNKYRGRKDDYVKEVLASQVWEYGIPIAVFKSMENCRSFYRSQSKMAAMVKGSPCYLRQSKCLHYYIYFVDRILGLVCMRIQSYAPFSVQYIINGHDVLARLMDQHKIAYTQDGNCFTSISDHSAAQELANTITGPFLLSRIEKLSRKHIPLDDILPNWYRFCVRQVEFSTDIYAGGGQDNIDRMRNVVLQLCLQNPDEVLSYITQPQRTIKSPEMRMRHNHLGSCVKFFHKTTSIKAYHKNNTIIRIETTSYDLRKITATRTVRHRDGSTSVERRPLTRALADIQLFFTYARLANNRLRERLVDYWAQSYPKKALQTMSKKTSDKSCSYSGMNFFSERDCSVLNAVSSPQFDIAGFKRGDLIAAHMALTPSQASYAIRRLKAHHIIKRENNSNRYFLTKKGRSACASSVTLQALILTPIMAA